MISWKCTGRGVKKMARYRTVDMNFWDDTKIQEQYSFEEKGFYLYLLTNPHTNLCGCYEIGARKIAFETGLTEDKANKLIKALQGKGVIDYSQDTSELLVVNWYRYNWTKSDKFRKPLGAEIDKIKDGGFKEYLTGLYEGIETEYRIDTVSENDDTVPTPKKEKAKKPEKWAYGENKNVMLTDDEYNRLCAKYGKDATAEAIAYFDLYLDEPKNKRKYTNHCSAMQRWVFNAVEEQKAKQKRTTARTQPTDINDYLMRQAMGVGNDTTGSF